MARRVPVFKLPDNIFVIISYLLWTLWSIFHFACNATVKWRVSAENIGIKVSTLRYSWPLYCYSPTNFITNLSKK